MTLDINQLTIDLVLDEGRRYSPYTDTTGHISIGVGRNLTSDGITPEECTLMLSNDIQDTIFLLNNEFPWWTTLSPNDARVMANLCFNMGWRTLSTFTKFLAALQTGDLITATNELINSRWYIQVGSRGPRTIKRLHGEA